MPWAKRQDTALARATVKVSLCTVVVIYMRSLNPRLSYVPWESGETRGIDRTSL